MSNVMRSGETTLACLIVDDPLLTPRYGYLEFEHLVELMRAHGFFTQIAFIPWNYRRSHVDTVELFRDNSDILGLCVHGCGHTFGEFASQDRRVLSQRVETALWWMEQHVRRTGLQHEAVFVFPQNKFTAQAMRTLREYGFAAAVNSTLRARHGHEPPDHHEALPFTTYYSGLPLFLRRTWSDRRGIDRDRVAGRPILLSAHHDAFRDGSRELMDVIDRINASGNVRWTSLGEIVRHYASTDAANPPRPNVSPQPFPPDAWLRVSIRRRLSELRDQHLETNAVLGTLYRTLRHKMPT